MATIEEPKPGKKLFKADEIIPGLWLGNLSDAENPPDFITHVITVADKIGSSLIISESKSHSIFEVDDHPCADILAILPEACNVLDEALSVSTNAALVHCVSGVSRSATTVIAWLMTRKGFLMDDALNLAKSIRPCVNPNFGFISSLELLEKHQGNFEAASHSIYSSREYQLNIIGDLREKANDYQSQVNEIENNMGLSGCGSGDMKTIETLEKLKQDIIGGTPQEGKTDDRVAKRIRNSVLTKIERLMHNGI